MIRPNDDRGDTRPVQLSLFDANEATRSTRAIAAASSLPKSPSRRQLVTEFGAAQGQYGMTPDEASERFR